jgi:hypothetical protein
MFRERDGIFNAKKTVLTRLALAGANGKFIFNQASTLPLAFEFL